MLQGKLTRASALTLVLATALVACGDDGGDGGGGGAIEENVVRPGITAMEQASGLACGTDGDTVRVAVESYTMLEGAPPADEAALVEKGYLREESALWDVVDGELVAAVPDCGAANTITAPATDVGEIVTSTEPAMSADELLATLTAEQIAEVGGRDCAQELATIAAAGMRFSSERGADPESIAELVETGYLAQQPELWALEGDDLQPASGSPCLVPDGDESDAQSGCVAQARTLEVAREAYYAQNGSYPTAESELVDAGLLREEAADVDLDGMQVVATPGGPCEGVDLG